MDTHEPASLALNISAYEANKSELERELFGRWTVFYDAELAGDFPDLQEAAAFAVSNYGRGPYMIRRVGAPPPRLPPRLTAHPGTTEVINQEEP